MSAWVEDDFMSITVTYGKKEFAVAPFRKVFMCSFPGEFLLIFENKKHSIFIFMTLELLLNK